MRTIRSRFWSILLIFTLSLTACHPASFLPKDVTNRLYDASFFQCGFDEDESRVDNLSLPQYTGHIRNNTLLIKRRSRGEFRNFWITPLMINEDRLSKPRLVMGIVGESGHLLQAVEVLLPNFLESDYPVDSIHLNEAENGELLLKVDDAYNPIGTDLENSDVWELNFTRQLEEGLRYFPMNRATGSYDYQNQLNGLYLENVEADIAKFKLICEGNTKLEEGYREYFIDFHRRPLAQHDYVLIIDGEEAYALGDHRIDTLSIFQNSQIPRGTDKNYPEMHPVVRESLIFESGSGRLKFAEFNDYAYFDRETFLEETSELRKPGVLRTIWSTVKWMGIERFVSRRTLQFKRFEIREGKSLINYGMDSISYADLISELISVYENNDERAIPLYTEFWHRRRAEGNSQIVYEILLELDAWINTGNIDVSEENISQVLATCLDFEQRLKDSSIGAIQRQILLSEYVEKLLEYELYASASWLVLSEYAEYGLEAPPNWLVQLTRGPNFSSPVYRTGRKAPFIRAENGPFITCQFGP